MTDIVEAPKGYGFGGVMDEAKKGITEFVDDASKKISDVTKVVMSGMGLQEEADYYGDTAVNGLASVDPFSINDPKALQRLESALNEQLAQLGMG